MVVSASIRLVRSKVHIRSVVGTIPIPTAQSITQPYPCFFLSTASSNADSFFSSSSLRSQRRKRRLQVHRARRGEGATTKQDDELDGRDTRSIRDLLFARPDFGDNAIDQNKNQKGYPKSFAAWKYALTQSWVAYKGTWEGFWTSKGFLVEDKEPDRDESKRNLQEKSDNVKENIKQNAEFLVRESKQMQERVTEATGISTKEDLRRVAAEMMRLAADCVNEFMSGYRKGRDDEVEKMLTQYFQELDHSTDKPRRRKIKRRILKRSRR